MTLLRGGIAGLSLLFLTSSAFAADAPQTLNIVVSNFKFEPNMLHLQRNTVYTLHLTNMASGGHSFSAPSLFKAASLSPEDSRKINGGKIEIPAGKSVDITLTPTMAGTYPVECSHFLHAGFGMKGQAVVE